MKQYYPSLTYPDLTMYGMVRNTALKRPANIAYEFFGKTTTYAEFLKKIDRAASALAAAGIKSGDRVTICMPNTPQALQFFYALNKIGAVPNMVHPLSGAGEIAFYLNHSASKAILTLDSFYEKIASIRGDVKQNFFIIVAKVQDELPPVVRIGYELTQKKYKLPEEGYITWKDFLAAGKTTASPEDLTKHGGDVGAILYSGGTTGTTKGIMLSNLNFNALALQTAEASGCREVYETPEKLKMLSVMPIFHGFGLGVCIHMPLCFGIRCILIPRFTPDSYTDILKKKKPNFIVGVPTLYEAIFRNKKLDGVDLSYLLGVFSGGDSLSIELKKKADKFLRDHNAKVQIREGYGTTECVTASCLTPKDTYKEGSIGVPYPDTEYCITKPGTCEVLAPEEEGEICISGPSVMLGYLDNPEETADTLRTHGDGKVWLHTGDLGKMDDEGFIYFRQRIKRMIISSGYNVYPSQVENVIDAHPDVLISCVIGVKDSYKMQKVKAFVVLRPGVEGTEEIKASILAHCKKNIAKYAVPYDIEFRPELPKTLVGKVNYRVLEAEEAAKTQGE